MRSHQCLAGVLLTNKKLAQFDQPKKISEGQKGKIVSIETRQKQSEWQLGRKLPKATKEKMRQIQLLIQKNPEVQEKKRLAMKAYWALKKAKAA